MRESPIKGCGLLVDEEREVVGVLEVLLQVEKAHSASQCDRPHFHLQRDLFIYYNEGFHRDKRITRNAPCRHQVAQALPAAAARPRRVPLFEWL